MVGSNELFLVGWSGIVNKSRLEKKNWTEREKTLLNGRASQESSIEELLIILYIGTLYYDPKFWSEGWSY